jgi:hypothetical protein
MQVETSTQHNIFLKRQTILTECKQLGVVTLEWRQVSHTISSTGFHYNSVIQELFLVGTLSYQFKVLEIP